MEFNLPPEIEDYIDYQVKSGAFKSADDLVTTALATFCAAQVVADIEEGYRQSVAGEFSDKSIEDIIRECNERHARRPAAEKFVVPPSGGIPEK